ncbi:MAG: catalase, partial [Pyramidobacter sp.]|nr:catalase [Pyramidobacter sp.]
MHPIRHFKTITAHKLLVMKYCFRLGLYWQGLLHDLSKYSPVEFFVGARYWQGTCSPNNAERKATGVSRAWLHHKGRNKHHFEYWIDYAVGKDLNGENMPIVGMKMPEKYVAEMFCDRIAASQVYLGEQYTDRSPWEYYDKFKGHYIIHPET